MPSNFFQTVCFPKNSVYYYFLLNLVPDLTIHKTISVFALKNVSVLQGFLSYYINCNNEYNIVFVLAGISALPTWPTKYCWVNCIPKDSVARVWQTYQVGWNFREPFFSNVCIDIVWLVLFLDPLIWNTCFAAADQKRYSSQFGSCSPHVPTWCGKWNQSFENTRTAVKNSETFVQYQNVEY